MYSSNRNDYNYSPICPIVFWTLSFIFQALTTPYFLIFHILEVSEVEKEPKSVGNDIFYNDQYIYIGKYHYVCYVVCILSQCFYNLPGDYFVCFNFLIILELSDYLRG